ncbi:MAG TPA: radical SAM family heme chaperone HemW [Actinomycetota bacterium]|nr:radical SAM family heme chaperone HemW [Actinomycetota bacterium]
MTSAVAVAGRTGPWTPEPGFGVYVHIPFCRHRCHYCDFNTYEGLDSLHDAYVDALIDDIGRAEGDLPEATSVFFGGGTPTLLPPAALGRILGAIRARVGIAPGAEVTVEANPETVDEEGFATLLGAGFNRTSIGVQSLVPNVLVALGRTHSPDVALEAIDAARRSGFPDISADLIFGSPWETPDDWRTSLQGVIDAAPDHISAYALTVEEGTPLATLVATGRVPRIDPDIQAERYATACSLLSGAGYERYEISNWARPGRAGRHNVLYWSAGDYLGFGAGAHGHVSGRRSWRIRLPRDYVAAARAGRDTVAGAETVGAEARACETLLCGLRLISGVDVISFERRHPGYLAGRWSVVEDLAAAGMIELSGGRLRLSNRGVLLGDDVIARLA